jgi:transcriptional regulator with XRE-family HTH domain
MPAVNGKDIRERRQRLGIKLGKFAELSGVAYKTLANIESGGQEKTVSIEVVWRLANTFGIEADDLLVKAGDAA